MQFSYTAQTMDGQIRSGIQGAKDREDLARILRNQGYLLTSASSDGSGPKKDVGEVLSNLFHKKVSLVDRIMFTRNLAVMIGAGLALNKALETLKEQVNSPKLKFSIAQISENVQAGKPFSDSIAAFPDIFTSLYVNMVKIGETAGNLEQVLNNLADQMKKDYDIVSRVKGALIYPGVIFSVMILVGYLMMIMVVPLLAATFKELGGDLPASTKFIIWLSENMKSYWYIALGIVVALVYLFRRALKTEIGKKTFDMLVLKMPVIKNLSKKMNSARFCRTLGILIDSGVPIVKALEILSKTLTNHFFSESLEHASLEIQKGKTLFESLKHYEYLYPPLVTQMISVGEEPGSLTKVLERLADFYEDEVNNPTKNLSTIIEPVMMVVIGAAVGFFAISMITPMYSVLNNI
ncbi:MAG: type II secretion system F family protein [Patescibacteria group bacterium]